MAWLGFLTKLHCLDDSCTTVYYAMLSLCFEILQSKRKSQGPGYYPQKLPDKIDIQNQSVSGHAIYSMLAMGVTDTIKR